MRTRIGLVVIALVVCLAVATTATVAKDRETGRGTGPIIYVTSQELYYDSIVTTELPMKGPFQELVVITDGGDPPVVIGLETEFGPGDREYVGGRWWVDANGNGEMDEEDAYFSCPLLGPGREEP